MATAWVTSKKKIVEIVEKKKKVEKVDKRLHRAYPRDADGNIIVNPRHPNRAINGQVLPGKCVENAVKITKENSKEYQALGYEKYKKAAVIELEKEFGDRFPGRPMGSHAVWGKLVAVQASKLLSSNRPYADDLYKMGQIIGALPKRGELEAEVHVAASNINVLEQADKILDIIERAKALANVVDADVFDVT